MEIFKKTKLLSVPWKRVLWCKLQIQRHKTGYGAGPAARVKPNTVSLEESTDRYLKENDLKPAKHPGVFHLSKVSLPEKFQYAAEKILRNENLKGLRESAKTFGDVIWSRRLPAENNYFHEKAQKIEDEMSTRDEALLPFLSEEQTINLKNRRDSQILRKVRQQVYHWEPIHFTKEKGLEYLLARSAGEYAVLSRIFNEISKRDPKFQPRTLCDFGSGVGTVLWAARTYWATSLNEHLCADVSWEMHELAELILRGGYKNNDHPVPALFFRQHLPESYKIRYDLVVSAFSLLEMPSAKDRLEIIDKLWKKTEDYLVIAEIGTMAGFRAVIEARDYILGLDMKKKRTSNNCHVFSPCPNNLECPRFKFDTVSCNFEMKYRPLYPFHQDLTEATRFCYVVMRRGPPSHDEESWPRLIRDPMIRPRHIICRMCTKNADISEVVLTKAKHSQQLRLIAKRSRWGDLLPLKIDSEDLESPDEYMNEEPTNNNNSNH